MPTLILSIGQCGFDDSRLSHVLSSQLGAVIDRAHSTTQANSLLQQKKYHLILVNRVFDADGSSGIDFIATIKHHPNSPPTMLISDYADAQQAAIANGAIPGFGKSSLSTAQTIARLKKAVTPEPKPKSST